MEIKRETFEHADNSTQNLMLFDLISAGNERLDKFHASCSSKHAALDKDVKRSGKINKGLTVVSGTVGGFFAAFASKYLGL